MYYKLSYDIISEYEVNLSSKGFVEGFLKKWKRACSNNILITDRSKNRDSLAQLGWTFQLAKAELKKLTIRDYVKGPEPDYDIEGELWFFGINSDLGDIYIKIKIFEFKGMSHAKCVSFHLAERPMKYPYK